MSQRLARSHGDHLLAIRDLYRASGEEWPASARDIAIWAMNQGHYEVHRGKLIAKAAEEFASAMREEHYTDPQGRRVRMNHAARIIKKNVDGSREQLTLWNDIISADRPFMERAFQQRRRQIVGDCRQLKTDVDSYNDNHASQPNIQVVFDFMDDLLELEQSTEYRPPQPR